MNLADMLTYADIGQLSSIAAYYDCDCKRNSKHELIQSILVKMGRRDFFEEQIRQLETGDLRVLNSLAFDSRRGYSLEDLTAVIRQASAVTASDRSQAVEDKGSPREALLKYRRSGWLFNGFTHSTKYSFHVPADLKQRFKEVLGTRFQEKLNYADVPEVYRDEQGLAEADLMLLLKYIDKHDVELNAEGFMYRRHQQQLLGSFHIEEELISKGAWRFGYGRSCSEYPDRLALLYDFVTAKGWVQEENHRLILSSKGKDMVHEGNQVGVIQLFRFWLRLYKGAIPNLNSLVYWISSCAKEWVTMASLDEALGWLVRPFYYDTSQTILEQRIIRMLMHLGMLRIGESGQSGTVIRMTALGIKAAEACVHIGEIEGLPD